MLTEEQIATRRTGIGASETPALLGLDPWKSPIDVYLRLHGLAEEIDTVHTERGVYLEPSLRQWASAKIGRRFDLPEPKTLRHPNHAHVLASPDGVVWAPHVAVPTRAAAVLELKAPGPRMAHEWGDGDEAPDRYVVQLAQQMAVCDAPEGYLAALVDGELKVYRFERDAELEGAITEAVEDFWDRHVVRQEMPEPDGTERYTKFLAGRWGKTRGELIAANGEAEDLMAEYRATRAAREAAELAEEQCKQRLQLLIGDADGIQSPVLGKIYWRRQKDKSKTDWRAVAEALSANQDLIAQHTTTAPGPRVFRPYLTKGE